MADRFDIASAIIEIVGDPEKFEAALHKAEKDGKGFVGKMGATMGVLAKIAIPAGIIGTVGELAKKSLEAGEEINLMSKRTGISTENLSRMAYAGAMVHVELDTISGAMTRMARQMAKGEDEMGKQSKVLQRMGVAATDSSGKMRPLLDVLLDVQDKMKDMSPAQRLNAAFELFGRGGGQKMLDLLGMTREQLVALMKESDKYGYTLSSETAEKLEHYNQALTRANLMMQGMARTATLVAIPAVEELGSMFEDDFPQKVSKGESDTLYYVKRFVVGVVGGFDLVLAGVKRLSVGMGYSIDTIGAQIKNSWEGLVEQAHNTWDKLQKMQPTTNAFGLPSPSAIKHNYDVLMDIRKTNDEIMQRTQKKNDQLWNQQSAQARKEEEEIYEHSLERIQKLWDEYFDHKAKKSEEHEQGNGKRELTDAEKEAILAVKEQIKTLEIETATLKGQHLTAYKLKLELIDIQKEKMRLKDIPTKLIDKFAVDAQNKALAEFKKISEENSRMAKTQIADQELAAATAAGLTSEIRRLSEAKIELTVAEMRQKGVTEDLIARYKQLASEELNDRLRRSSEETLRQIADYHRQYAADILNTTMTEGEKARLAAKDKLDKRLDDLRKFGDAHQDQWVEVLGLQKDAYEAYYAELSQIDRKYDTSWQSMFRRIGEEAKASSKRTAEDMDSFAKSFVSSMSNFVGEEFYNTFTLNFDKARESARNFFRDLLRQILNFLAQQAVMKFINLLVSKWGGTGTAASGSNSAGGFISMFTSSNLSGHRAGGGMVWNRGVYELAEEGPEAVVPTRDGGKIPVKLMGGGASSSPIDLHQTIVITPDMFAAMRPSPEEIVTIVNSDFARNGQTRKTMRVRR